MRAKPAAPGGGRRKAKPLPGEEYLVRRPGSEDWQIDITIKGRRLRRSSGTADKALAAAAAAQAHDALYREVVLGERPARHLTINDAFTQFYVEVAPLMPALHSAWFIFHIIAACAAGAAFNVGAIAAVLFLIRERAERRAAEGGAEITGYLAKLPSSARLDLFSYRMHAFGVPLWTFVIVAGAIWAQYAWGRFWDWDPKETWSFITWLVYVAYLHARATAGWRGRPVAIIAVIGVVTFWFNFVGVNLLFNGMHSYSGI